MKLNLVCQQYAAFRKALGERFVTNGRYVKAFCQAMGSDIDIAAVSPEKVNGASATALYLVSIRCVCRTLRSSTAAADSVVRRCANTDCFASRWFF